MAFLCIFAVCAFVQDIPFKPKEEFEINLNYEFRQRPLENTTKINFGESYDGIDRNASTAMLPYLKIDLHVTNAGGAVKARIENNKRESLGTKKVKDGSVLAIDIGYTDDAKDRVTAHEFVVIFIDENRQPISKVVILIEQDGSFTVNGEKRGKF